MTKANNAFFFDFETLGQNTSTCPVLCCAGMVIDLNSFATKEWTFDELYEKSKLVNFNVEDQVKNHGKVIEKSTLEWWEKSVKKDVRLKIFNPKEKESITKFCEWLNTFDEINHNKINTFFSRGQAFDLEIANSLIEISGHEATKYIPWWSARDTRSFIEGATFGSGLKNNFIPKDYAGIPDKPDLHDPITDIVVDVLRFQYILSI